MKKKNNILSIWWLALFFGLFEIIFYILQLFNLSLEWILFFLLFICLIYLSYLIYKKKIDKRYILYILIVLGFMLRIIYISKTNIYTRQHDVGDIDSYGHLHYIYYIFSQGSLPDTNFGQFYHPPLFHFIGALWLFFNSLFKVNLFQALEGIQFLTLFFSSVSMIVVYKLIDKFDFNDKSKLLANIIMIFFPTFVILSGSINNDCLLTLLQLSILYYLTIWYKNDNLLNTIVLALLVGLCVMTKLNGALIALPVLIVFIKRFIEVYRNDKKNISKYILKLLLFGLISIPIGLWFQVREIILFKSNSVPNPANWLFIGNYSFIERFLPIDFSIFSKPFVILPGEYNIFSFIIKSSIFGEYNWGNLNILHYLLLIFNVILIFYSLYLVITYIFNKKRWKPIINLLVINWAVNVFSYIVFNIKYPFLCTMDYRYITTCVLTGAILIFDRCDKNSSIIYNIVKVISLLFALLCILLILSL